MAYRLDILTLRPDLHPEMLEGSACTLLMDIEDEDSEEVEFPEDSEAAPESYIMEPPLTLTVGLTVVLELATLLMDSAMTCRIDVSRAAGPWRTPLHPRTKGELQAALAALLEDVNSAYEKERIYPIDITLIPRAEQNVTEQLMDEYRHSPYSWVLWRRILGTGIVQVWLSHDAIHVATECDHFARVLELAKRATSAWNGEIRWSSL